MVRTRFAPSPTGYLHIGGLRTALYAYLFAKQNDGKFILRIEDTDLERYVEGAVEIIYRTLKAVGLDYDEGGEKGGPYGPYTQSERKAIYQEYAHKLVDLGGAYYCFCSKDRLEELKSSGATKYDKHCYHKYTIEQARKKIAAGESYCIRQNIPESGTSSYEDMVFGEIAVDYKDLEDGVLLKSDGMPTYNFANVVDDHLMNITHVIRGVEYLSSTPKYNLIYDAFSWERPKYIHLQPVMKDATHKLSKRHGDASFEDFIKKGFLGEAIVNYIALLGWSPKDNREKLSMQQLLEAFSIEGLSKSASIFDEVKMRWLNSLYIAELPQEKFLEYATPFFDELGYKGKYDYKLLTKLLQPRIEIFSDIKDKMSFLGEFGKFDPELFANKKNKTDTELARRLLPIIIEKLESIQDFGNDNMFEQLKTLAESCQVKSGALFWIMRIALTGALVTPGGATEMAELLGKEETIKRLKFTLSWL